LHRKDPKVRPEDGGTLSIFVSSQKPTTEGKGDILLKYTAAILNFRGKGIKEISPEPKGSGGEMTVRLSRPPFSLSNMPVPYREHRENAVIPDEERIMLTMKKVLERP